MLVEIGHNEQLTREELIALAKIHQMINFLQAGMGIGIMLLILTSLVRALITLIVIAAMRRRSPGNCGLKGAIVDEGN